MTLSTGKLAQLAHGAVTVQVGETMLLATVTSSAPREGIDFFPLTVDVEERMYAAGKIPGSFFRREGRPGEQAILTARLTDRPLRPCFPDDFRNEVQVISTILGVDLENPHDIPSINGASAALVISGIPFTGPIGAVRLAHYNGQWIAQPTYEQGDESTFELVVAGRVVENGDVAIMMVEAGGTEASWEMYNNGATKVTEETIAEGLEEAKQWIKASCELQLQLRAEVEKANGPIEMRTYEPRLDYQDDVYTAVEREVADAVSEIMLISDKSDRQSRLDETKTALLEKLCGTEDTPGDFADREKEVKSAFSSIQKKIVRTRIVNDGVRIDGRSTSEIRPLSAEIGVVPTAHGTGLFQRGETQVLSVTTLGMPRMEQMLDTIGVDATKRYMHHYNFPPFSTGETGRVGSPKRREIGHGVLAERALIPVIPSAQEWPYTLRVVSDVLASNGSTSMASVCGSTLSLMDAGVPIKAPVAGIAMGLVFHEGKYTTLTDILGAEDAFGDMDFKVAGTSDVVTALQLDTKIDGIPADVLAQALQQAKQARLQILGVLTSAIAEPRSEVRASAPKIVSFEIPLDKIGEVIGPKGKVINTIQQETGADIAVSEQDNVGMVTIGSKDGAAVEQAQQRIELILNPPEAELGATYAGEVVNITKFGAFVNILPGRDGLVHISKLGGGQRIDRVEDVLAMGDKLSVRVDDIDENGKLSLTPLDGEAEPSEETESEEWAEGEAEGEEEEVRETRRPAPRRSGGAERASFSEFWDSQAEAEFGDLGPAPVRRAVGPRQSGGPRTGRGTSRGGRNGGRNGGRSTGRGGGRGRR